VTSKTFSTRSSSRFLTRAGRIAVNHASRHVGRLDLTMRTDTLLWQPGFVLRLGVCPPHILRWRPPHRVAEPGSAERRPTYSSPSPDGKYVTVADIIQSHHRVAGADNLWLVAADNRRSLPAVGSSHWVGRPGSTRPPGFREPHLNIGSPPASIFTAYTAEVDVRLSVSTSGCPLFIGTDDFSSPQPGPVAGAFLLVDELLGSIPDNFQEHIPSNSTHVTMASWGV